MSLAWINVASEQNRWIVDFLGDLPREEGVTGPSRNYAKIEPIDRATFEHEGIWCDECHVKPICGDRYTKRMESDTFDLCAKCFGTLQLEKQSGFKIALLPGELRADLSESRI